MRLLIMHAHNSYNIGSAMMLINGINELAKKLPSDTVFLIDVLDDIDLNRYRLELPGVKIEPAKIRRKLESKNIIKKIFKLLMLESHYMLSYNPDACIVLGGDDFSEYYHKYKVMAKLFHFHRVSKRIPTIFLGQTIGPFKSWRKFWVSRCLRLINIYARDRWTSDYLLTKLSLDFIRESGDLAFLPLPMEKQSSQLDTLLLKNLKENNYITIVPSGLVSQYTDNPEGYFKAWADIIIKILDSSFMTDKNIVLLTHVYGRNSLMDDYAIRCIVEKLPKKILKSIIVLDQLLMPSVARSILGEGYLTITGRMHAAISTLQQQKPSIALSYSVKYKAIIGQELGLDDLLLKIDRKDWLDSSVVDKVLNKMNYVNGNYKEISNRIHKGVSLLQPRVKMQIDDTIRIINKGKVPSLFDSIVSKKKCTGCGICSAACSADALSMELDHARGEYLPVINYDKCTQCGLCDKVCPAQDYILKNIKGMKRLLGEFKSTYTGWSCDDNLRFSSSSGGVVSSYLIWLLDNKIVDKAVVVGDNYEEPLYPKAVIVDNKKSVIQAQGSKYCPVTFGKVLSDILNQKENKKYAIVALPCHLNGIRRLMDVYPVLKKRLIVLVGLFCNHTPSFRAVKTFIKSLVSEKNKIKKFTYRGEGWPGKGCLKSSNKDYHFSQKDLWSFIGYPCFSVSGCRNCKDVFAESADISFGDAWLSEFRKDKNGVSIFVVRKKEIDNQLKRMDKENKLVVENISLSKVLESQAGVLFRKKRGFKNYLYLFKFLGPVVFLRKYMFFKISKIKQRFNKKC